MAKTPRDVVEVDEAIIQNMMSGDIPSLRRKEKEKEQRQENDASVKEDVSQPKTEIEVPVPKPKKRKETLRYSNVFLENKVLKGTKIKKTQTYISEETVETIRNFLPVIAKGLTVPTYIDNILKHHLELYKDEINELYDNNNSKKAL